MQHGGVDPHICSLLTCQRSLKGTVPRDLYPRLRWTNPAGLLTLTYWQPWAIKKNLNWKSVIQIFKTSDPLHTNVLAHEFWIQLCSNREKNSGETCVKKSHISDNFFFTPQCTFTVWYDPAGGDVVVNTALQSGINKPNGLEIFNVF